MDAPEVTSWTPGGGLQDSAGLEAVGIKFTSSMDRSLTESAFSLTEDDEELRGEFLWEEKAFLFKPFSGFRRDCSYALILRKTAEDEYGNSLEREWNAGFSTGSDETPPIFLYSEPEDMSLLTDTRQEILLVFSEPPDEMSLRESLSLSPDLLFTLDWLGDSVKIRPLQDYAPGKEIRVSLSVSLKDRAGNAMERDVDLLFRTAEPVTAGIESLILQSTGEDLTGTGINRGIEKNDVITGSVNRPLSEEERVSFVSMTPDASYDLRWDSSFEDFTLSFEDLAWQGYYDLEILENLYLLIADGEGSRPPDPLSLSFSTGGSDPPRILSLNCALGAQVSSEAYLDFLFLRSQYGEINAFSFMDALTIDSAVLSFDTTGCEFFDGGMSPPPAVLPGTGESLIRVHLEITDTGLPGIVTFSLADTLCDSLDNTMTAPWSLTVNQP